MDVAKFDRAWNRDTILLKNPLPQSAGRNGAFLELDSQPAQPVELVINSITKDHIHGYVSAPKYRQSELASMQSANANANTATNGQAANTVAAAPQRQKLPTPQ